MLANFSFLNLATSFIRKYTEKYFAERKKIMNTDNKELSRRYFLVSITSFLMFGVLGKEIVNANEETPANLNKKENLKVADCSCNYEGEDEVIEDSDYEHFCPF